MKISWAGWLMSAVMFLVSIRDASSRAGTLQLIMFGVVGDVQEQFLFVGTSSVASTDGALRTLLKPTTITMSLVSTWMHDG